MTKPRQRPQIPNRQQSRQWLASVDTESTVSADGASRQNEPRIPRGEKVDIPNAALFQKQPIDWGKYGFYLTLGLALCSAIWIFADTYFSVKSLGEDVKELKHKAEDFAKNSFDFSNRLTNLEKTPVTSNSQKEKPRK